MKFWCMECIREAIEIELHPDNVIREESFSLRNSLKPLCSSVLHICPFFPVPSLHPEEGHRSSKLLVSCCNTAWLYNPEDLNLKVIWATSYIVSMYLMFVIHLLLSFTCKIVSCIYRECRIISLGCQKFPYRSLLTYICLSSFSV
jgi:hypothetical protein